MPPSAALQKEVLERLIAERAQLQYARDMGLKIDDAALTQAERVRHLTGTLVARFGPVAPVAAATPPVPPRGLSPLPTPASTPPDESPP